MSELGGGIEHEEERVGLMLPVRRESAEVEERGDLARLRAAVETVGPLGAVEDVVDVVDERTRRIRSGIEREDIVADPVVLLEPVLKLDLRQQGRSVD